MSGGPKQIRGGRWGEREETLRKGLPLHQAAEGDGPKVWEASGWRNQPVPAWWRCRSRVRPRELRRKLKKGGQLSPCGPGGTCGGDAMGKGSLVGEKMYAFVTNCITDVEARGGKPGDCVGLGRKIVNQNGVPVVSKPCTGVEGRGEVVVSNKDGTSVVVTIIEGIVITMDKKDREWRWWVTTSSGGEHPGRWPGFLGGAQRKTTLNVGVKLAIDHARSKVEEGHDLLE